MKRLVASEIMNPEAQNSFLSRAQEFLNNAIGGLLNPAGGADIPITAGGGHPDETPVEVMRQQAIERERSKKFLDEKFLERMERERSTPVPLPEYVPPEDPRFPNSQPVPFPEDMVPIPPSPFGPSQSVPMPSYVVPLR